MLILGIDPGTATTGYGLLQIENSQFKVLDFGLIETEKNGDPGKRLVNIYHQISDILKRTKPDIVAIEKIFFATNAKTAISVGQAQGVFLFSAARVNIPVYQYAPGSIKKTVAGDGRADKKAVQQALRKFFGPKIRSKAKGKTHFDNAADALAIALCHAFQAKLIEN